MNRNALNSVPIGMGNPNNLIQIIITQVLQAIGSLRATVIKYSKATTEHVVVGTVRAERWVYSGIEATHEAVGEVLGRAYRPIYAAAVQVKELIGSALGYKELPFRAEDSLLLEQSLDPVIGHAVHGAVTQVHILEGTVKGHDLNYEWAPQQRRVALPDSPRRVAVLASTSSGV